jgi:nitroimidazol reductase NimA-like FMN-containing flavoprotein (pyridoxamine 5'-phosphate oxidase superfamily)
MPRRTLVELSPEECFDLLSRETVGRFVYVDDAGPAAVPVNYGLGDGAVVFRSEDGSKIEALSGETVAFEVDHIEEADRSGWSVLLRGKAELFDLDRAPELIRRLETAVPVPWKAGIHTRWVRISPTAVTGRRLGAFAFEIFF